MEAVNIIVKILMVATFVNAVMGFSWMAMGKLVQVNIKLRIHWRLPTILKTSNKSV